MHKSCHQTEYTKNSWIGPCILGFFEFSLLLLSLLLMVTIFFFFFFISLFV